MSQPRRLLSLSNASKADQDITTSNLEQSGLLKLPAEIRNRIFHLALGGKTVHVNLRPDANWLHVCEAQTTEDEVFDAYQTSKTAPNYIQQHRNCEPAVTDRALKDSISFSLLGTCRTIYDETALLPFSTNTFIIRDEHRLERFCQRLMPAQQRAVQDLEYGSTDCVPHSRFKFRFHNFTCLHHVRIRMELVPHLQDDVQVRRWNRVCFHMAQNQLSSASVITYRFGRLRTRQETWDWAAQVEAKLMVPKSIEADRKREEAKMIEKRKRDDEDDRQQKRPDTRSSHGLRSLKK